jgi:uncharacterized membrane protein
MDYLDDLFSSLWETVADVFLYIIDIIPTPDFVDDAVTGLMAVVEYAAYPAWLTGIDAGIPMVASAYGARFILKRLPIIG